MRVFYDRDADVNLIKSKNVGIIGYGSQGHAHAANLRDSGVSVVVGLRADSPTVAKARNEDLRVSAVADAVAEADVVMMTLPDEHMAAVYRQYDELFALPGE